MVQNPDQGDVRGSIENNPLMSTSNRLYLNADQDRDDETRNVKNFEDGDFAALRPNYDRRAHAHHNGVALT